MLSTRKKIAAAVGLVMATAGVAATADVTSSAAEIPVLQRKAAVSVSIVPSVIGPGKGLQSSSTAKWAVVGRYSPNKEGKKVVLQRQSGTSWVTADKGEIGATGQVVFAVSGTAGVVYRVDGPGAASTPVSTDSWGTPADFADDFSGTSLNLAEWQHRQQFYEPASRRTCAKGDPRAVRVARGTVALSVLADRTKTSMCKPKKPGKSKIFGKFKWRLNANIGTQATHSITYGVVAARIKFQPLQGQHASLWLQPTHLSGSRDPRVGGTEIDVIEWFGKDTPGGGLTSFIYAPSYAGTKLKLNPTGFVRDPEQYLQNEKDDWYKRYHVFSVEWSPSGYIFRIDGQETGRITKGVSAVPEYPILSVLSSDYELKKIGDEKNLPQTMNVDWIRTYQNPAYYTPPATPAPAQ
jgi:beta-glucanase (GH16 family)